MRGDNSPPDRPSATGGHHPRFVSGRAVGLLGLGLVLVGLIIAVLQVTGGVTFLLDSPGSTSIDGPSGAGSDVVAAGSGGPGLPPVNGSGLGLRDDAARSGDVATAEGTIGTPPAVAWNQRFGGDGLDVARTVVRAPGGDVVAAGFTTEDGDRDAWLARVTPDGTLEWSRRYGGDGLELARDVVVLPGGGFAFVGSTRPPDADESAIWLVEVGSDGSIEETRTFESPGDARGTGLVPAPGGGYTILGDQMVDEDRDVLVFRTDGTDGVRWERTYGGDGSDVASDIAAAAGGVVVTGTTDSTGADGTDIYLLGLDAQGQIEYRRTFGGSDDDFGSAVTRTRDGGVVLAGATRSFAERPGDRDMWLIRTDADGVEQWSRTYGGPRSESSAAIVQSKRGGYTIAGDTYSYGAGRFDAWVVRTDADGAVEWTRTVGGSEQDTTRGLVETANGGYVVAGATEEVGGGSDDAWLFRLAGADAPGASRPIEACGAVLDEPGRYELTTDLDHQGDGACLTVSASNVTIDGQGNRIAADDRTGTGVSIENPDGAKLADITVENLVVVGFDQGISHSFSDPLIRLRVTETTVQRSGTAMQLHEVTDLVITRNTIVDNEWGIAIEDFRSGVQVRDNRISGTRYTGLFLFEGGTGPVVSGNIVAENGRGIWASNDIDDPVITDNQVVNNRGSGIHVKISYDVVIRGNRVAENDGFGIGLGLGDGKIVDNDVGSNDGAGISLEFAGGTVADNDVGSNDGAGISLIDSDGDVTGNRVVESGGDGIYIEKGGGRITGNLVRANDGTGISIMRSWGEFERNEVVANDGAGVSVTGTGDQDSGTRLVDNRIADNCGAGIQFAQASGAVLANEISENAACG